jgi:signal transduction histidine kinase
VTDSIAADLARLRRANDELGARLKACQQELHEHQIQLLQNEKMASLGNLVAGVAHEINTPLGALVSNNDLFLRSLAKLQAALGDSQLPPEAEELFATVTEVGEVSKTATHRIMEIVSSLRIFARLDPAEKDKVDIHQGLDSTLTLVHHELKNRIEIVKSYGELPAIECFSNRLNQVFLNILINACQAIEGKGKIEITTRRAGDKAVIEIRDSGSGMSAEVRENIFDPGFTTKGVGVGTGLGLSIVKQIISDHEGQIEVESEQGQGSLFRIILPIGGS